MLSPAMMLEKLLSVVASGFAMTRRRCSEFIRGKAVIASDE